jgi:hypothetical protein
MRSIWAADNLHDTDGGEYMKYTVEEVALSAKDTCFRMWHIDEKGHKHNYSILSLPAGLAKPPKVGQVIDVEVDYL